MYLVAVKNLISRSKIESALRNMGIKSITIISEELEGMLDEHEDVKCIVAELPYFNLNVLDSKIKGLIRRKEIRLIGYYPHSNPSLREAAIQAGFHDVYPNAAFFRDMRQILASK